MAKVTEDGALTPRSITRARPPGKINSRRRHASAVAQPDAVGILIPRAVVERKQHATTPGRLAAWRLDGDGRREVAFGKLSIGGVRQTAWTLQSMP